jgi:HEAT repeat protein
MGNFTRLPRVTQQTAPSMSMTPGRTPHSSTAQPNLAIGQVDSPLEHQADRMAEQVMRKESDASLAAAPAQVSPTTRTAAGEVNGRVASEIRSLSGGGAPLPESSRAFFESRLGHDFGAVRIHSDDRSAKLARSVDARAFTLGRDIVFGAGEYSPQTGEGTRLLAHELTHVAQQRSSQAIIQRQPTRPVTPYSTNPALDETYEQLEIVREGQLPLELSKLPKNRALDFQGRMDLEFKRKLDAIHRLGELRAKQAVLTLVALLEDRIASPKRDFSPTQKFLLKQAAADALAKIGDTAALSKLSDLLKSKDPDERKIAAQGLPGATGGQAATDLLKALQAETDDALKAQIIFALGRAAIDLSNIREKQAIAAELIRQMEIGKDTVQLAAISVLGKLRLKSATEPLLKQLLKSHRDEAVAAEIVSALGEIRDQKAVDLVMMMLRVHEKPRVRREAALALGKIGGPKARAALQERLNKEKDAGVKAAISKAMMPSVIHWTFRAAQSEPPRPPSTPP